MQQSIDLALIRWHATNLSILNEEFEGVKGNQLLRLDFGRVKKSIDSGPTSSPESKVHQINSGTCVVRVSPLMRHG